MLIALTKNNLKNVLTEQLLAELRMQLDVKTYSIKMNEAK